MINFPIIKNYYLSIAEEFKNKGNELFSDKKFELAIQEYSKAIENSKPPQSAAYYCNRALCYIKMESYELAI